MAGCTCVCVFFLRQLWLSCLFDDSFPGVASRGTAGILLWLCIAEGPEKKDKRAHGCVYLRSGVGASLQVYVSCHALVKAAVCSKSPAVPQSSWHGERQRESAWSRSGPHADAFLSYRRLADAKIKQKERCLYLFVYSSFACQMSTRWQTGKSTTAARRERTNVSSGAVYLTGDVIIIHSAYMKSQSWHWGRSLPISKSTESELRHKLIGWVWCLVGFPGECAHKARLAFLPSSSCLGAKTWWCVLLWSKWGKRVCAKKKNSFNSGSCGYYVTGPRRDANVTQRHETGN